MASHYPGTPDEVRALDAYIKLMRASDAVAQSVNRPLADHGLTTSQFGVLEALVHLGPLAQGVLARKILTSPANLTHVLDQLEERGWLRRVRDESDRRVVRVALSPAGEQAIRALLPEHVARVQRAFTSLDADTLTLLTDALRTVGHDQSRGTPAHGRSLSAPAHPNPQETP